VGIERPSAGVALLAAIVGLGCGMPALLRGHILAGLGTIVLGALLLVVVLQRLAEHRARERRRRERKLE
jgi:uncharacterized membrane protein YfcA